MATKLEKSVFIPIPKKGNAKQCSNYRTIALISHARKVMLKFSKPGFSNTSTVNFLMFRLVSEKAEEPEIKLPTSVEHQKSKRVPEKHLFLCMLKALTMWITTNCGKFLKGWEYQTTLPASCEICMQVKKQQ